MQQFMDKVISPEDELKKAVTRAFDLESSKVVLVDFGGNLIRSDYECKDKGTTVCDECRIRFMCYLNQYLILSPDDLNFSLDWTFDESVEAYIESAKPEKERPDTDLDK